MKRKWSRVLFMAAGVSLVSYQAGAQQATEKVISVQGLFTLVKENHPALKTYRTDIDIARQSTAVAKNQLLPELTAGAQAYYLGDAYVLDKDFSNSTKIDMPHFGNKFSVDARQLIWKGNAVRNGIKIQTLREELSELSYESNEQNIKLLVLSYYLDLAKLYNQEDVYRQNIQLAEKRLNNINKFYDQGMVTRNDVIRGQLQISNLKLALQVVNNNQDILNKQLTVALGLNESVRVIPEKNSSGLGTVSDLFAYKNLVKTHPSVLLTQKAIDVYTLSAKITRAEMKPSLAAFGGNSLQRPITTASPALDMYTNGWSAGLSLNFNIDALFKSPKKVRLNLLERERAENQANEVLQSVDVAVNAAYIKYREALSQNSTLKVNTDLTAENYRIMESKYNNQLAILLDMIDASNAKLDAELQYANSQINIVYAHYKLLKEAGNL